MNLYDLILHCFRQDPEVRKALSVHLTLEFREAGHGGLPLSPAIRPGCEVRLFLEGP